MQSKTHTCPTGLSKPMPETMEVLLSAMAGCGLILLLAFFLSLESWLLGLGG